METKEKLFIDYKDCKYFNDLENIRDFLLENSNKIYYEKYKNNERMSKWDNAEGGGMWSLSVYHDKGINTPFNEFDFIQNKIKNGLDCFQCFFNFIAPKTTLPKHTDTDLVSIDENGDIKILNGFGKKLYQCVFSINIPSSNDKLCAFNIGDTIFTNKNGDITIFDGNVEHYGWNYTNDWRITMVMDLKRDIFN